VDPQEPHRTVVAEALPEGRRPLEIREEDDPESALGDSPRLRRVIDAPEEARLVIGIDGMISFATPP
jgi:hypothetical protein